MTIQGAHAVALETGLHSAVFWPDIQSLTARVRGDLDAGLELGLEGTLLHIEDDEVDTHPNIYVGHGNLRQGFGRHLSAELGLALGASAAGGFVAPDVGATLAYEDADLAPFLSPRGYLSQPLFAREVLLDEYLEEDEEGGEPTLVQERDTPETTFGLQLGAGLRVPLHDAGEERGSLHFGVGVSWMADSERDIAYPGMGLGLSLLL